MDAAATLITLGDNLKALLQTHDKEAAKVLLSWVEKEGLSSLKTNLQAILSGIVQEEEVPTYTIPINSKHREVTNLFKNISISATETVLETRTAIATALKMPVKAVNLYVLSSTKRLYSHIKLVNVEASTYRSLCEHKAETIRVTVASICAHVYKAGSPHPLTRITIPYAKGSIIRTLVEAEVGELPMHPFQIGDTPLDENTIPTALWFVERVEDRRIITP
ncbi:Hypothetical protein POVN_LOCUS601 [uncultured virus]|nr:Hypothetical protein POVN_LOCUS601 [uncultured virus]